MLILAGVSLNATIGDNGIITRAQEANYVQSVAILEEYLNSYYVEHYEQLMSAESKVQALKILEPGYFFQGAPLGYIVDNDLNIHYFINKEGLPEEIKNQIIGGDAGNKTYADYANMKDVYGVTKDLKVYYCRDGKDTLIGATNNDFEDPMKEVFTAGSTMAKLITGNDETSVTAEDLKSVKSLTITPENGITSFSDFYQLISLEQLILQNLTLNNLNGLENTVKLNYIEFSNTTITEENGFLPLAQCTELNTLYMYMPTNDNLRKLCNGIKDAEFSKLTKLGFYGFMNWNVMSNVFTQPIRSSVRSELTDISSLANLTQTTKSAVKTLYMNNNKIEDVSSLAGFNNLETVRLECNNIKTISPAFNNINPKYLVLNDNQLGLNESNEKNEVTDAIASLVNANRLVFLILSYNTNLKNVSYIKNCTSLNSLSLEENNNMQSSEIVEIKDILAKCTELKLPSKYYLALDNSTKLDLRNLNLEDSEIEFLKGNKNLLALNLSGNTRLTNDKLQEVLATLPNLQALSLQGITNLTSIEFTKSIHNLVVLRLLNTSVTDLSLLNDNETRLATLVINNANIDLTRIQPTISRLKSGNVYVAIMEDQSYGFVTNNATLIQKLKDCIDITNFVSYNYSVGATNTTVDLSKCTKLIYLLSRGNACTILLPSSIETVSSEDPNLDFSRCTNIKTINLTWGGANNTSFAKICEEVKDKRNLKTLYMGSCSALSDISPVSKLSATGLKEFSLKGNANGLELNISNVSGLAEISTLQTISITYTKLANLPDFSKLTNLKTVTLTNNYITSLIGFKNCINLTTMNCSSNQIASLYGIENLKKLTTLNLSVNSLFDTYSYTDENGQSQIKRTVDTLADLNKNGALNNLNISSNGGITGYGELPNLEWSGGFTK